MTPNSLKFVGGTVAAGLLIYGGWRLYGESQLRGFELKPIEPGKVNIIAVNPGSGYRIIVSNQVAQLAEVDENEFSTDDAGKDGNDMNTVAKKKLPIREYLKSLNGDGAALGKLIESLNDIKADEIPATAPTWKAADIRKAIAGDAVLKTKLEQDLNTKLNGMPLERFSMNSLSSGISIEIPITMEVPVGDKVVPVECVVREGFKTQFASTVEKKLLEKFRSSDEYIGIYQQYANWLIEGKPVEGVTLQKEDVVKSLESRFSEQRKKLLQEKPSKVLSKAFVLANESQMTSASFVTLTSESRKISSDITINMTHEGHFRLWKYSRQNPGFQLLFVVDGVAVAAPRIGSELAQSSVTIKRVGSELLAKDSVDRINLLAKQKS